MRSSGGAMRSVPRTVWALGVVSLLMDLSSELVHALLPVYLTVVLGASMVAVGLVEGIAEATASIAKVFSGALSDRLARRKPIVVLGYALAMLSKPLFPLAGSVALVLGARFMDRIGKGIRGAPRDALIADVTPAHSRGAAYGLRQALDTVGAALGPLAAIGFMLLLSSDIRSVLWVAFVPALASVAVLLLFVREAAPAPKPTAAPLAANGALDGEWTDPGGDGFDTPIFRSLRSAWLSTGDETQPWRTSEIEAGWEMADQVAETPAEPEVSQSGLPVRRPGSRLVPGGVAPTPTATVRDPEAIRARLAAHASGVSRGRAAATAAPDPS